MSQRCTASFHESTVAFGVNAKIQTEINERISDCVHFSVKVHARVQACANVR